MSAAVSLNAPRFTSRTSQLDNYRNYVVKTSSFSNTYSQEAVWYKRLLAFFLHGFNL